MLTHTLQIHGLDHDAIDAALVAACEARGYLVLKSAKGMRWEKTGEFCARIGLHPGSFRRSWRKSDAPFVHHRLGPKGRVIELVATPEFEAWILRYKATGEAAPRG